MVLDTSAFVALERGDPAMVHLAQLFAREGTPLVTSAGVLARLWRAGRRQVALEFLLRQTKVVDLTGSIARLLGRMLGTTGTADPIDAHVVHLARERGWPILTANAAVLRTLDGTVRIEEL